MRTEEERLEMLAAKKQEEPDKIKSYDEGLIDGWLHCLKWMQGD